MEKPSHTMPQGKPSKQRIGDENLVLFPRSTEELPRDKKLAQEVSDDPLEQLLNEFSEYEQEAEESADDNQFESLLKTSDETDADELLREQCKTVFEMHQRIQYFLEELENLGPRRSR